MRLTLVKLNYLKGTKSIPGGMGGGNCYVLAIQIQRPYSFRSMEWSKLSTQSKGLFCYFNYEFVGV